MKSVLFLTVITSFTLTSCMHSMMMGGHGSHSEHQAEKVIKEVRSGEITMSVVVDPMTLGNESAIQLAILSEKGRLDPVNFHYMISKKSGVEQSAAHDHSNQKEKQGDFKTIHENIVLENGRAVILFAPSVAGEYLLTVESGIIPGTETTISSELSFTVHEQQSGEMMGMSSSTYWYIGGAAMAAMMILMWSTGGIF